MVSGEESESKGSISINWALRSESEASPVPTIIPGPNVELIALFGIIY